MEIQVTRQNMLFCFPVFLWCETVLFHCSWNKTVVLEHVLHDSQVAVKPSEVKFYCQLSHVQHTVKQDDAPLVFTVQVS